MSPLYIEIALHYHCRADEFPRLHAPACTEAVAHLMEAGLLKVGEPRNGRVYEPTDGLTFWVKALCSVPLPVRQWALPSPPLAQTGERD